MSYRQNKRSSNCIWGYPKLLSTQLPAKCNVSEVVNKHQFITWTISSQSSAIISPDNDATTKLSYKMKS